MTNRHPRTSVALRFPRRGMSLTEVLVAVAISLVFMGSVVTAYIQIARAADVAEARIQGHTRARTATDAIVRDLRRIRTDPSLATQQFLLVNDTLTYGDKLDGDGDTNADEEVFDGRDDDSDWTVADDRHATINTTTERGAFVGVPDYGDAHVDEDCLFSHDTLTFRVPEDAIFGTPTQDITYRIDTFDGQANVLVREVVTNPGTPAETTVIEPVIFDVVSLDFLAADANFEVASPPAIQAPAWIDSFDPANYFFPDFRPLGAPFGVPPFQFPAAVLVRITVGAQGVPVEEAPGWPLGNEPLKTVSLSTVVDLEVVTKDIRYQLFVRPKI